MNTGSRDAGVDPDWDRETNSWKGKYNTFENKEDEPRDENK